jgi:hypothetical protein
MAISRRTSSCSTIARRPGGRRHPHPVEHDAPIPEANQTLLARLSGPRRLYVVPGGDHLFQDPAALRRAGAAAVAWLREHLR